MNVHSITLYFIIDMTNFITKRCESLYQENIKNHTKEDVANRMKTWNKVTEFTHLLIEI